MNVPFSLLKPTLRGWLALLLAVFAVLFFPFLCPVSYVQSGVGTFLSEPVRPVVWVLGAGLILICAPASVEAFRRGTRVDKVFAALAVLLTLGLMVEYFQLWGLPVHPPLKLGGRPACPTSAQREHWNFLVSLNLLGNKFPAAGRAALLRRRGMARQTSPFFMAATAAQQRPPYPPKANGSQAMVSSRF